MMDGTSDHSTAHQTEDLLPPCCLEDEPGLQRRRLPMAELCVVGSVVCGFLLITGATMVGLHYTVEPGDSLASHYGIASHILGLSLMALSVALILLTLLACAVFKVLEVVEMAHRYQEHREFCAYEDLRQSFRSQQSERCAATLSRYSNADSKDTPRK